MRLIYIHQYFRTPEQGGAVRSFHLAKGLVRAGVTVDLITAHNGANYDQRWIEGIRVHYLPVAYDQSYGFWKRIWAFYRFVRESRRLVQKLPRPDLLYITSTPLTTGLIGLWAKRKLALPYIFEVRDLWPEAPIQVGAITNPLLKRLLYSLEKRIYDQALSLVALSPGIAAHLQKVSPERDIALIPNFSDLDTFFPKKPDPTMRAQLDLGKGLTIAYTGALGQVNAVEELLDLAEMAQRRGKSWNFLIMGSGSRSESLHKTVKSRKLERVRFIPPGGKTEVNEILALSDIAWISFAHLPVLKTNSPNKFFDALAAGKAIVVNQKGWVYDLVKEHHLGISCLPGKMEVAFRQLEHLDQDRAVLEKMGINSRRIAAVYFSKELAVARLLEVVNPSSTPKQGDEADIRTA
jgi:glycosyltransferase involved in cell wall biosynthesis